MAGEVQRLLTIGSFAKRCGLSSSALRFYGECGLLLPAETDHASGYRYYTVAQVREAVLIKYLRATEMPVAEVRAFLSAEPAVQKELLNAHVSRVRERAAALDLALERLRQELESPSQPSQAGYCTVPAEVLALGLGQVFFAAAQGEMRPELRGIWVEVLDGSLRLVTTDSYRLAVRDLVLAGSVGTAELSGFVPLDLGDQLREALTTEGLARLWQDDDGSLHMCTPGFEVVLAPYEGAFPDYRAVLEGNATTGRAVVCAGALSEALSRFNETVTLAFTPTALLVGDRAAPVRVRASWDGPALSLTLNPSYLIEALRVMVGPEVLVEASGPLRPLTLRSADTGSLSVLTMPIKP